MKKRDMKKKSALLKAVIQIGKEGITNGVVEELKRQLKEKKLVKVKFLRSALEKTEREQLARELQEKTNAILIEIRGNTAVYQRK
ncbi:MAG: 50S ribosomal protein L10 [Methanocellales archaeon]